MAKIRTPGKTGRPTLYSDAMAMRICLRIADGESLRRICADLDMPSETAVYSWLAARPGFAENYACARMLAEDASLDEMGRIADMVLAGELDWRRGKVIIDSMKWRMVKMYGKYTGHTRQAEPLQMPGKGYIVLSE